MTDKEIDLALQRKRSMTHYYRHQKQMQEYQRERQRIYRAKKREMKMAA